MRITDLISKIEGGPWDELRGRRGNGLMPLAMWAARRFTGLTLREIGEAAGNKDYSAVSMAIKRFEQRIRDDSKLAETQSSLVRMLNVET